MTSAAVTEALGEVLSTSFAAPVEVTDVSRISAGASAQLSAVTVRDGAGAEHALVLRVGGIAGGLAIGTTAEAAVLDALAGRSIPVPTLVASFAGHAVLGDGYLMNRLDGETVPRRLLRDAEFAAARDVIVDQAAAALADIHRTAVGDLDQVVPTQEAAVQVAMLAELHRSQQQPSPTFELAFRWLAGTMPPPSEPRLVHGDFRNGNLMLDASGLVAVLDWELAHLGDPVEDLGWFCAPAWRFGGPGDAGGFGSREQLLAAYEAASGSTVDPAHLRWWEVLATVKWGVICQVQASRHLHGKASVEHAAIGRRVSETELDLLLLLEER